jgi:coenzyme F420 hydrogenase subunit beta
MTAAETVAAAPPAAAAGSPALARVRRGDLCSGCGACAALAPEAVAMRLEGPGFLRPAERRPPSPAEERAIVATCPGLGLAQDPAGRPDHPLWGPVVAARTGWAVDPALRLNASSGGALSAILVHLLATGAVDRVLQTAAAPDLPIGNRTVISAEAGEVFAAAGSRYAPSAPLAGLGAHVASGLAFAFVGKPCDAAALQSMKARDPAVAAAFPYVLSFFCAGVPSLAGAREVLARLGAAEAEVAAFRYRGDGWPGFATATLADGSKRRMSYADSWGGVLSRHVQLRCKLCPDGTGGFADVVCADAWEADADGYPRFLERDGVSLILSRTSLGEALVADALAAGAIAAEPFDLAGLAAIQPGQAKRRRLALGRLAALRLGGREVPRFRGFHLAWNAARAGLSANLRNVLGTALRLAQGRL